MTEKLEQFSRRVEALVAQFERDVDHGEWFTRRYPKRFRSRDGSDEIFEIPALYLQKGPTNVLLDPISYDATDAEGMADLYLMPTYDPTASVFFENGEWMIYYAPPTGSRLPESTEKPAPIRLSPATINRVLDHIADHAVSEI